MSEGHNDNAQTPDEVIVESSSKSAGSDNDKVLAAVSTIFPVGLIIYYAMKDASAYVKNYAAQGTVLGGLAIIVSIAFSILGAVVPPILCLSPFIWIAFMVVWVILLIKALQEDKNYQFPVIGDIAKNIFK